MKMSAHNWRQSTINVTIGIFWGDLMMPGFLLGLQGGHSEYSCFFCLWTSRVFDQHYIKIEWSARKQAPSAHIVTHVAQIPAEI